MGRGGLVSWVCGRADPLSKKVRLLTYFAKGANRMARMEETMKDAVGRGPSTWVTACIRNIPRTLDRRRPWLVCSALSRSFAILLVFSFSCFAGHSSLSAKQLFHTRYAWKMFPPFLTFFADSFFWPFLEWHSKSWNCWRNCTVLNCRGTEVEQMW